MEEIAGPGEIFFVKPHHLEPPKETFFFQREDGSYFADSGNNASMTAKKFKFVGSSDGRVFREIIANGQKPSMSKDEAGVLIQKAFNAELEVALANKDSKLPVHNNIYGHRVPEYLKGLLR